MHKLLLLIFSLFILTFFSSCEKNNNEELASGYIDADYVYISASCSAKIKNLYTEKGFEVKVGDKLFEQESVKETAFLGTNENMDKALQYYVADMQKGARPQEIIQWQWTLDALKEFIIFAKLQNKMYEFLALKNAAAEQYHWLAKQGELGLTAFSKAVESHIAYMKLPERPDKIAAFEMADRSVKSMIPYTKYQLQETLQTSPCDAVVFDIFYWKGELVQEGKPVIMLLPKDKLKAVFYVKGSEIDKIKLGNTVKVHFGKGKVIDAKVSYISQNIQYTDPLIYSLKNNEKLLYSVEAQFSPTDILKIHPGEVVSVEF